jgi:hypothetical protein
MLFLLKYGDFFFFICVVISNCIILALPENAVEVPSFSLTIKKIFGIIQIHHEPQWNSLNRVLDMDGFSQQLVKVNKRLVGNEGDETI